ncbi:MAG: hypothetical protein KGJ23_02465 [Euryarchaeota archaeon]|nr:hypothetical protein [Euryarchaeota archaeon]MDE1835460.1 hypothetical protein [Euryarchaeota archaeon]MDE2046316.1 hypothetical protein [Thermoplasmata archaeon]
MVRRGRAPAVNDARTAQRRLDEPFSEGEEARTESDYRDLRETRGSPTPLPYEERVAAWIREREEAIRRRNAQPDEGLPPQAPPPPAPRSVSAPAPEAGAGVRPENRDGD